MQQNTRFFVTDKQAGSTIQLKRGDEVTFNLVIGGGRDWTAVSGDTSIARPMSSELMHFANGQTSRLLDFGLVRAGHVTLTACPSGAGTCTPTTPGALSVDVDVS